MRISQTINLRLLTSPTSRAFALRGVGAGLAFALNVAVGRLLGADGAGLYFLALSIVSIAAVVSRMGFENTIIRFVASFVDEGAWGKARGVLNHAVRQAGFLSLVFSVVIALGGFWASATLLDKPDLGPVLLAIGFAVIAFNLMTLFGEALKGASKIGWSMTVTSIILPATALIAIAPLVAWLGVAGAGLAYLIGAGIAALAGIWLWQRTTASDEPTEKAAKSDLDGSSRPLWLSMIILRAVQPWAPLLLLALWATDQDVGILGAATRVALLISFFLISINSVLSPRFATLLASENYSEVKKLARSFAFLLTALASPLFFVLIVFGDPIMAIFGPDFENNGHILAILAIGQAINCLTGPVGVILMMGGQEKAMRILSIASAFCMIVTGLLLVPVYGLLGAAIMAMIGHIVTSLGALALVYMKFGFLVFPALSLSSFKQKRID